MVKAYFFMKEVNEQNVCIKLYSVSQWLRSKHSHLHFLFNCPLLKGQVFQLRVYLVHVYVHNFKTNHVLYFSFNYF